MMKIQQQTTGDMQALGEKLKDQRTAMVTMADAHGLLKARPMTALEMDGQGAIWFMASRQSMAALFSTRPAMDSLSGLAAVDDGHPDERAANIAFSDEGQSLFVSIAGDARLVDDMARKVLLWSAMARPWFKGSDDPDLVLLCVQPRHIDIWDGPDSSVARALAMVASVAAGRPLGLGERDTVIPPAAPAGA